MAEKMTKENSVPSKNEKLFQTEMFRNNVDKIKLCLENNWPMLCVGHAGTGKNEAIYYACAELNMPVIRIGCAGDSKSSTLLGRINIGIEGKPVWQNGPLTIGVEEGYVVIMDELNALDPDVLMPVHGLLDELKMIISNNSQLVRAHPDFRFVGTMNPISYYGTKSLNQAFNDRFFVHEFEFDEAVDDEYLKMLDCNARSKTALKGIIEKIRDNFSKGELSQNWGHRTTANLVRFAKVLPLNEAMDAAYCNKLPSGEVNTIKTIMGDFIVLAKPMTK